MDLEFGRLIKMGGPWQTLSPLYEPDCAEIGVYGRRVILRSPGDAREIKLGHPGEDQGDHEIGKRHLEPGNVLYSSAGYSESLQDFAESHIWGWSKRPG